LRKRETLIGLENKRKIKESERERENGREIKSVSERGRARVW